MMHTRVSRESIALMYRHLFLEIIHAHSNLLGNQANLTTLFKSVKFPTFTKHPKHHLLPSVVLPHYMIEEAKKKLDSTVKLWLNTAMKGSHPFVMQSKLVCGCRSQILSEVVKDGFGPARVYVMHLRSIEACDNIIRCNVFRYTENQNSWQFKADVS